MRRVQPHYGGTRSRAIQAENDPERVYFGPLAQGDLLTALRVAFHVGSGSQRANYEIKLFTHLFVDSEANWDANGLPLLQERHEVAFQSFSNVIDIPIMLELGEFWRWLGFRLEPRNQSGFANCVVFPVFERWE